MFGRGGGGFPGTMVVTGTYDPPGGGVNQAAAEEGRDMTPTDRPPTRCSGPVNVRSEGCQTAGFAAIAVGLTNDEGVTAFGLLNTPCSVSRDR